MLDFQGQFLVGFNGFGKCFVNIVFSEVGFHGYSVAEG